VLPSHRHSSFQLLSDTSSILSGFLQPAQCGKAVEQGGSLPVCLSICVQRAALKAPPPFGRTLSFPKSATRLCKVRTPAVALHLKPGFALYIYQCFPGFNCIFIALKSRTCVFKPRTKLHLKFVRDLYAKVATMGVRLRGGLGSRR
jgi:hypothetical protein